MYYLVYLLYNCIITSICTNTNIYDVVTHTFIRFVLNLVCIILNVVCSGFDRISCVTFSILSCVTLSNIFFGVIKSESEPLGISFGLTLELGLGMIESVFLSLLVELVS